MRTFLFLFMALIASISMNTAAQAQTSKIMDTNVSWTNYGGGVNGHVKIFLTDTVGLTGLTVNYGSTDTSADYFSGTYTIPGSFTSSGCTSDDNNVLTIPIGHRSESVTGYLRLTLTLSNGSKNNFDFVK